MRLEREASKGKSNARMNNIGVSLDSESDIELEEDDLVDSVAARINASRNEKGGALQGSLLRKSRYKTSVTEPPRPWQRRKRMNPP